MIRPIINASFLLRICFMFLPVVVALNNLLMAIIDMRSLSEKEELIHREENTHSKTV